MKSPLSVFQVTKRSDAPSIEYIDKVTIADAIASGAKVSRVCISKDSGNKVVRVLTPDGVLGFKLGSSLDHLERGDVLPKTAVLASYEYEGQLLTTCYDDIFADVE